MKMEVPFSSSEPSQFTELGGILDFDCLSTARERAAQSPKHRKLLSYPLLSFLADVASFSVAFSACLYLLMPSLGDFGFVVYLLGSLLSALLPIAVIGGYSKSTELRSARFFSEHIIASGISAILLLAFMSLVVLLERDSQIAALYGHAVLTSFLGLLASIVSKRILESKRAAGDSERFIFVIGAFDKAREIYSLYSQKGDARRMRVFDFDLRNYGKKLVPNDPSSPTIEHISDNEFPGIWAEVDTVVLSEDPCGLPTRFVNRLMAVNLVDYKVETARKFISSEFKKVSLDGLSSKWLFEGGFSLLENTIYYRAKCVIDFVVSAMAMVLLVPLLFMVGLLVKLTSKGPVFFKQQRVGVGGKPFTLYKFRTMKVGSEKGHLYTLENDPRITSIGNFLRSTRLDELPQLLNVLKGQMSLVGPRAEWVRCVEGYEANIPYYHYRHLVKPGITGWAQVNYPYGENELDTIEKLKFDLYYVRHFSLTLDFSIFVKTIYVMLGKHGSR